MTICAHFCLAYNMKIEIKIMHTITHKSQFGEQGKGIPWDPVLFRHALMPLFGWLVQYYAGEALYRELSHSNVGGCGSLDGRSGVFSIKVDDNSSL